ncbi:SatD family protein [Bacillus suaedaesalsae]|uniref:DNA-binding protein n=1 Tax=Bacillus suaedaesalsae TaxID=2810349 RepID=A0ABS2DM59_9BACI|nr:SatD family protein [Bacillus suaedaesalsae]MBM6619559.1 DNA-binding protein [Bacillus suaedaesalsae]
MNYCAIIGDIVGSKKLQNRQETQDHFKNVLNAANEKYDKYIASKFTVTLGDEFQGLLVHPSLSFEIIEFIKDRMNPIELVFGIGIGKMETSFDKHTSIGSDGPAYWYARKMVDKAKLKEPSVCLFSNSPEDSLINSLLLYSEMCSRSRTDKQEEIVRLYKVYGSQKKVADKLNISQSAVSKHLKKAFYHEIDKSNDSVKTFLKNKWE